MTTKAFAVFTENKCIFGEGQCYAIYPKAAFADQQKQRMQKRFSECKYEVREIEIGHDLANWISADDLATKEQVKRTRKK